MGPNGNQDPNASETVEVLGAQQNGRWTPAVREETLSLLASFKGTNSGGDVQIEVEVP